MRVLWLYVLSGLTIWPVHWTAATMGDKPIDLMMSDLLPLLMPITYFFIKSDAPKTQVLSVKEPIRCYSITPSLALLFIIYAMALAGIGTGMSAETMRLYSAFKLAKPIGFVFMGMLIGLWTDPFEFLKITGHMFGILVLITLFYTVTAPEFPMGEWGRYIFFELELSGYPNSPMSFYAALVPFLLVAVDISKYKFAPILGWGIAFCATLIILGSMSRSSSLALIVGVVVYLATTGRVPLLVASTMSVIILSAIGFGLFTMIQETEFVSVLSDRIQERIERSTEQEDPTSGRAEIWKLAIELWTERPLFGYLFESFSHYAEVDTPHQQYLEVLHKCGGVGFALYVGLLGSCLTAIRRLLRMTAKFSPEWYQLKGVLGMMLGILFGNLTQPNLTFSLTGNLVFLVFGCLCGPRAVVAAGQRRFMPLANVRRPIPVGVQRAAA